MHASKSARSYRETSPLQCVRASGSTKIFPGASDAGSHLQLPQDNLGGAAYRKRSNKSLRDAGFRAQRRAESFPELDGIAPASKGKKKLV